MNKLEIYELEENKFNDFLKLLRKYKKKEISEYEKENLKNDIFHKNCSIKVFISENKIEYIWFMFLVNNYSVHYLKNYYFLSAFFIDEKYRSKWYWTKMFEYLINYSKENNLPRISWSTDKENIIAQKFYDKYDVNKEDIFYKMSLISN